MKPNGDIRRKERKVTVCCEDPQATPHCRRANRQIDSGTLDSDLSKPIVIKSSGFIVLFVQWQISVESEILFELFEAFGWLGSREQFLFLAQVGIVEPVCGNYFPS